MNPVQIASIQWEAAKAERQKIASNMRIALASSDEPKKDGVANLWLKMADMIERGDFSR